MLITTNVLPVDLRDFYNKLLDFRGFVGLEDGLERGVGEGVVVGSVGLTDDLFDLTNAESV